MKRSPMPARRTQLRRRALNRTSSTLRRGRKRRSPAEIDVREAVFARDGGCVLARMEWHTCWGQLTPHHLRKEGQGGGYTMANLVTLCSDGNDGWVESYPDLARELGLLISHSDTEPAAWARMTAAGLVYYGPDGGPVGGS